MDWYLILCTMVATASCLVASPCLEDGGNWYCRQVDSLQMNNIGLAGTYERVVDLNGCQKKLYGYNGSLAPLNEEAGRHPLVTIAFRGPLHLKQFAAYIPNAPLPRKRDTHSLSGYVRQHAHRPHAHMHHSHWHWKRLQDNHDKRDLEMIVASWGDEIFSWSTDLSTKTHPTSRSCVVEGPASNPTSLTPIGTTGQPNKFQTGTSWNRMASYDAASSDAEGLVFLKQISGPVGYCAADGVSIGASPEILQDVLLPSNEEFTIWTNQPCSGESGSCGYYYPGIPAYHGFAGSSKAFLFEFAMPMDNDSGGTNPNKPAIWMLNSQIPRVEQYGCNCWPGCGEFDIFEVLTQGDYRMKSTVIGAQDFTAPDYFTRPCDSTVKGAVVMSGGSITIRLLDDDFDFGSSLTSRQLQKLTGGIVSQWGVPH